MELRDYTHARGIFQQNKGGMSFVYLAMFSDSLLEIKKNLVFENEIWDIEDLIEDVEIEIDILKQNNGEVENIIKRRSVELINPSDAVQIVIMDYKSENLWSETERELFRMVLQKFGNNKEKTAKHLGINVRTVRNKMHLYKNHGETTERTKQEREFYERRIENGKQNERQDF